MKIFLSISLNICYGCSKEPSLFCDPQHVFWLTNKKTNFFITHSYLKAAIFIVYWLNNIHGSYLAPD